jgi:hemerythrin-like domain-containing protein
MIDPVAAWHAEHQNFSRLLDLFDREVAVFHSGERPDYELLLDIVAYLRHFPDMAHHPREDIAFARLVGRDPSLGPMVARLQQEHRVIAAVGARLQELLEVILDGAFAERVQIEAACATFLVYYRHHILTEEQGILPRAAELLDAADWRAIADAHAGTPDPLFGDTVEDRYRELRRKIVVEAGA